MVMAIYDASFMRGLLVKVLTHAAVRYKLSNMLATNGENRGPGAALDDGALDDGAQEFAQVNPRLRFWLTIAFIVFFALGAWATLHLREALEAAEATSMMSPRQAALDTIEVASIYLRVLAAGLGLFGLYLLLHGRRIWLAEQYPPPGAWVMRPLPIVRGRPAKARALLSVVVALFLVACSAWLPTWAEDELGQILSAALAMPDTPSDLLEPVLD